MSLHFRPMTTGDIAAGLRLCRLSSWNQLEDDWRLFLNSPDGGGWLAENDGAVLGTVAWLRYRRSFAWLSMMLVDPVARRAGIGSRLFEAALDVLADMPCVRLDATPAGEPLYRRHGFVPEYTLVRAHATVTAERFRPAPDAVRPMTAVDLPGVFALDRGLFGADRSAVLASFYSRAPEFAWTARDGRAYCLGRPGALYGQLGPIVAESQSAACDVLSHCLASQPGRTVIVDAPRLIPEWTQWLESAGFVMERPFLRMRRGGNRSPGILERQFGIAGPEFG